jgi:uncharacterized protein YjiS (DUF1127 family)
MERVTLLPQTGPRTPIERRGRLVPSRLLAAFADTLVAALERSRQRRALRRLDDRMLRDIGVTQADVVQETGKPLWRP